VNPVTDPPAPWLSRDRLYSASTAEGCACASLLAHGLVEQAASAAYSFELMRVAWRRAMGVTS
jgi:hypothetical protein